MKTSENTVQITGVISQLALNGVAQSAVAPMAFGLDIDADINLRNVRQEGSYIKGEVVASIDVGFGSVSATFPFSVNTGLANPYTIHLGYVNLPILGSVSVDGSFGWNLPARKLSLKLYVAGLEVASKTVGF